MAENNQNESSLVKDQPKAVKDQPKANEATTDAKGNPVESPKLNPSYYGWIVAGVLLLILMFRK